MLNQYTYQYQKASYVTVLQVDKKKTFYFIKKLIKFTCICETLFDL